MPTLLTISLMIILAEISRQLAYPAISPCPSMPSQGPKINNAGATVPIALFISLFY